MSGDPRNVCQHREWTDRKIDTNEDGDAVRYDVEHLDTGDDFMAALTPDQQREMARQVGELYLFLVGPDVPQWGEGNPRHNSVTTRLRYLFGESLGGDNLGEFRALLDNAVSNAANVEQLVEQVAALEEQIRALAEDAPAEPAG